MSKSIKQLKQEYEDQEKQYNELRNRYRATITLLLKAILEKNGGKIVFTEKDGFTDELDMSIGHPNVTYDGGNHPEYASNVFSLVNGAFLSEGNVYVDCEDCEEYHIERIWDTGELSFVLDALIAYDEYEHEE